MLPEEARSELGLEEFVVFEVRGSEIIIKKANGERKQARAISRNLFEVVDDLDGLRSVVDCTAACGATLLPAGKSVDGKPQKAAGPGSIPGEGPFPKGRRFWK